MEHAIDHDSKFPVAVKAVVFFEDTFLVLRRSAEDVQAAGEWDIPGWRLESGESPQAGIVREILEETGLSGDILAPSRIWTTRRGNDTCIGITFIVRASSTDVSLSHEHSEWRWIGPDRQIESDFPDWLRLEISAARCVIRCFASISGTSVCHQKIPVTTAAMPCLSDTLELLRAYPNDESRNRLISFVESHPDSFVDRYNPVGHITASAWIVNPERTHALLIHHVKLGMLIQPGGHVDPEDTTLLAAALREAQEETGIIGLSVPDPAIFDLDIHPVPARGDMPAHTHYDIRFLIVAEMGSLDRVNMIETHGAEWVPLDRIHPGHPFGNSIIRMAKKTLEQNKQEQ